MNVYKECDEIRNRMYYRVIKRYIEKKNEIKFRNDGKGGNNHLPYGIAEGKGIDTDGLSPRDVWEKLEEEGVSPELAYKALEDGKTGEEVGEYATVGNNSPLRVNKSLKGTEVTEEMLRDIPAGGSIKSGNWECIKGKSGKWYSAKDSLMSEIYSDSVLSYYFKYEIADGEVSVDFVDKGNSENKNVLENSEKKNVLENSENRKVLENFGWKKTSGGIGESGTYEMEKVKNGENINGSFLGKLPNGTEIVVHGWWGMNDVFKKKKRYWLNPDGSKDSEALAKYMDGKNKVEIKIKDDSSENKIEESPRDYSGYIFGSKKNVDKEKEKSVNGKDVTISELNKLPNDSTITLDNGQIIKKNGEGTWNVADGDKDDNPVVVGSDIAKSVISGDSNVSIKRGSDGVEVKDADFQKLVDNSVVYATGKEAYEDLFDETRKKWMWFSEEERDALYRYTLTSGNANYLLRSYYEGCLDLDDPKVISYGKKKIDGITKAINKCELKRDMKLFRGAWLGVVSEMLGIDEEVLKTINPEDLIGMTGQERAFMSCGTSEGSGFDGDVKLEIYCPAGTKGIYAEPFSHYGYTVDEYGDWDGKYKSTIVSDQNETILQRGTKVKVCGAKRDENGKLHIALAVIGQSQDYDFPDKSKKPKEISSQN